MSESNETRPNLTVGAPCRPPTSPCVRMSPRRSQRLTCLSAVLLTVLAVAIADVHAEADSDALTIYSSARPGSIPAEIYQPGMRSAWSASQYRQMIPGYAIVKQNLNSNFFGGQAQQMRATHIPNTFQAAITRRNGQIFSPM